MVSRTKRSIIALMALSGIFLALKSAQAYYVEFGEVPTPTPAATATPVTGPGAGGVVLPPGISATPTPSALTSPVTSPTSSLGVTPGPSVAGTPPIDASPALPSASVEPSMAPATPETEGSLIGSIVSDEGGVARASAITMVLASAVTIGVTLLSAITASRTGIAMTHLSGFVMQSFWEVVGLKRRRRVWGTVYDATTKRGVAHAKVELMDASGRVLETRYADQDGRYGFLVQPAGTSTTSIQVRIRSLLAGYQFPSKTIGATPVDYIVYDHIYGGELLTIGSDSFVSANIPMDPVRVSVRSAWFAWLPAGRLFTMVLNVLFWIGVVAAPIAYWYQPTTLNLVILVVFVLVNIFRMLGQLPRAFGIVSDAMTGKPVPYALVLLNDRSGARVTFNVSDALGRYCIGAKAGSYVIRTVTPAQIAPQRSSETSLTSSTGWITALLKL